MCSRCGNYDDSLVDKISSPFVASYWLGSFGGKGREKWRANRRYLGGGKLICLSVDNRKPDTTYVCMYMYMHNQRRMNKHDLE